MPADVAYLGIDLGTSSVKIVAIGEGGSVLGQTSRTYELSLPKPGWREIDPELWWSETVAALRELLGAIAPLEVRAIGVTGQMHTLVPVGADGHAAHAALMWNDVRTARMVAPARDALLARGARDAAATVSTGSPALNLCWLRDNEPKAFERTERFVIGPDWIVFKLTGILGTDFCEASTSSLFDFGSHGWSYAALDALGLPARLLPAIRGSREVAGGITSEASSLTGLIEGTPVIVGTGDNPAAAIPTGCITEGATVISLGTSGVVMGLRADDAEGPRRKGKRIAFSPDGCVFSTLVQGVVQSCGSTRDWLLEKVLRISHQEAEEAFVPRESGTGEVLFFPHMTGEKTLFGDASLRGAFVGLSPEVTAAELDRAAMEGVGYGFRQLMDEMGFAGGRDPVRAVGGGARSDAWMQTLANILDRPMQRMEGETGAGYGAALLARIALGGGGSERALPSSVRPGAVFTADERAARRHDDRYRRYLRMHDALVGIYGD